MRARHLLLLIALIITSCKKPFDPAGALANSNKYLVIDGVINTGTDSTSIRLSRTKKFDTVISIDHETGAQVSVESDANSSFPLAEVSPGNYSAAPLNLDNSHKYRLRIKTTNGEEYLSDFVTVKNAPTIDSIGFVAKASEVQLYVNSHDPTNNTKYYRWEYTEAWKFHTTLFSAYDGASPRRNFVYNCYAKDTSSNIILSSTVQLSSDVVYQAPITTISSTAEKIEVRYSIEVKQYALTSDAYAFWNNLYKNNESRGSIFDAQPSDNVTNYHCITNPGELVVGYLSAGSVATKRIFIDRSQLPSNYDPKYPYECKIDTSVYPLYAPTASDNINYTSLDGLFPGPILPFNLPNQITYTTRDCADCTSRGVTAVPPFWK